MPIDATSPAQSDGSIWSTAGANSRQKRVMPSRSRRGGPGLGHCEVDNLILETQKRKLENEPLIPADTPFLLTTNPRFAEEAPNNSNSGIHINVVANDRYFDRPDVLKAFREQAVIQTPEYEAISESISVGGRFRPRNQDEAIAETSDAAYEKRHRKFENFEKRQRLREKEKLKHEHYKLKERIEQLRAMDGSMFMTLPDSAFTPPPQEIAEDDEEITNSPYVAVFHVEGERRRKEMLDVALKLEKRYAYLLPPRKVPEASTSSLKDIDNRDGEETAAERDYGVASKKEKVSKPRLQSVKSSTSTTPALSPVPKQSLFTTQTLLSEPKRPATTGRKHGVSMSSSAEPPNSVPPEKEKPIIIVDDESPEHGRLPSQFSLPPTPLPVVQSAVGAPEIHSPEPPAEQQAPLAIQSNMEPEEDVLMETSDERRSVDINITDELSQPHLEPSLNMANHTHMENLTLADEELERVPSDAEDVQEPALPRKRRGRPPKQRVHTEVEPGAVENIELASTSEPAQPQKKRRGRRPKASFPDETAGAQEMRPLPETWVQQRIPQQEDVAGASKAVEQLQEIELTDSSSGPTVEPLKKRRGGRRLKASPPTETLAESEMGLSPENGVLQREDEGGPSRMMEPQKKGWGGRRYKTLPPPQETEMEALPEIGAHQRNSLERLTEEQLGVVSTTRLEVSGQNELTESASAPPAKRRRLDREMEPEPEPIPTLPVEEPPFSETEQPQKKRRGGRRPKTLPSKVAAVEEDVTEASRLTEEQPAVVSGIRLEGIPRQIGLTDSTPARRRRRNEVELQPGSISAAPPRAPLPSDRGIAAASASSYSLRGKTYVSYVDGRTGETVHTPSLLMVACVRAMEKTNLRRARDNISFGGPTPEFGKGPSVEYELREDILYRDFRDKSLDASGSVVGSDVDELYEESEQKQDDPDEEKDELEDEEVEVEVEDVGEDQIIPVNRQSPEEQLSSKREGTIIEGEHNSKPPIEPQNGRDENHRGTNSVEQCHHSRNDTNVLVYRGPYHEQLIASPEAEPMAEVLPGFRTRVRSRPSYYESDDELIWD